MLRVRWLNRDSSWLTTKPMRANVGRRRREDVAGPACRRSRGTTTTTSIYDPPRSWDNRCHSVTTCNGPGFKRVLVASAADVRW